MKFIKYLFSCFKDWENKEKCECEQRKIKHLEFIQASIIRMAANSFLIKNWCVTLITSLSTAVLVLGKDDMIKNQIIIALTIPVLIFWVLDSFFLSQERKFIKLYNRVSKLDTKYIDYSMNINEIDGFRQSWIGSMFSKTKLLFYIPILITLTTIIYLINQ
jgi:hypothetical protein